MVSGEKVEGLQHLGSIVENFNKWLNYLKDNRIDVLMNAETEVEGMGRLRAAYAESNRTGGVLFELIEITPK
jgi:hypothetical protein